MLPQIIDLSSQLTAQIVTSPIVFSMKFMFYSLLYVTNPFFGK